MPYSMTGRISASEPIIRSAMPGSVTWLGEAEGEGWSWEAIISMIGAISAATDPNPNPNPNPSYR